MDEDKLEHLHPRVQQILVLISNALSEALGESRFASCWVVLHGSAAQPTNWDQESSDLNLMGVMESAPTISELALIHDAIEPLRRMWPMTLELVSHHELERSTDVFPLKYLDIQRHHVMLHGPDDALVGIEIAWDHLRLRIEQRLKTLLGILRVTLPQSRSSPEQLVHLLDHHLATFWHCLSALLFLRDGDWWVSSRRALIDAANTQLTLDAELLEELLLVRRRARHPSCAQLHATMSAWHDMVTRLADMVDHLDQRQEFDS